MISTRRTLTSRLFRGPLRVACPRGVARIVALAAIVCYILSGGRNARFTLIPLPFGLTSGIMAGTAALLAAVVVVLELCRGEVTLRGGSPTTLGLDATANARDADGAGR